MLSIKVKLITNVNINAKEKNYQEDTYQNIAVIISEIRMSSDFSHCFFLNYFMCFSNFSVNMIYVSNWKT